MMDERKKLTDLMRSCVNSAETALKLTNALRHRIRDHKNTPVEHFLEGDVLYNINQPIVHMKIIMDDVIRIIELDNYDSFVGDIARFIQDCSMDASKSVQNIVEISTSWHKSRDGLTADEIKDSVRSSIAQISITLKVALATIKEKFMTI